MEEVKEVIPFKPEKCQRCGLPLEGESPNSQRPQGTEIPPLVSERPNINCPR